MMFLSAALRVNAFSQRSGIGNRIMVGVACAFSELRDRLAHRQVLLRKRPGAATAGGCRKRRLQQQQEDVAVEGGSVQGVA